jgi:hypothetical protein
LELSLPEWVQAEKPLAGIGDEAFDTAGAVMLIRKGDKLIRIVLNQGTTFSRAIKVQTKIWA